jgi:hypothetical protein
VDVKLLTDFHDAPERQVIDAIFRNLGLYQ